MNSLTLKLIAASLLTGALAASAGAAGLPKGYPESFQRIGVIDQLPSTGNNTIVINDYGYPLSRSVVVHSLTATRNIPIQVLRVKTLVGFSVVGEGPGARGEVTEVWQLPSNYKPAE